MGIEGLEMPPMEEEEEESPQNGLVCFIDLDRNCGADCMAFTREPFESTSLSTQQSNCTLLVSAERLGRYTGGLVKVIKNAIDDAARTPARALDPLGKKLL